PATHSRWTRAEVLPPSGQGLLAALPRRHTRPELRVTPVQFVGRVVEDLLLGEDRDRTTLAVVVILLAHRVPLCSTLGLVQSPDRQPLTLLLQAPGDEHRAEPARGAGQRHPNPADRLRVLLGQHVGGAPGTISH